MEAAIAGLKKMQASDGSWTYRGMALVRLATLFDWLYDELDHMGGVKVASAAILGILRDLE